MPEIIGTSAGETLIGTSGADIIRALEGNDIINGADGFDELHGGEGDDIFYIDDANGDQVIELAGQGNDQVYVGVSYLLTQNSSVELLSTNNHASTAAINLTGNSLAQTIVGNAGANVLIGGGGADFLSGLGGNDVYYIDVAGVGVAEAAGGGNDAIYTGISYVLAGGVHVETLSTNNHASTAAINLTGNSLVQTIVGNAGANVLIGGGGADFLNGLGGDDIYYIDVAGVGVAEAAGGGNDAIYSGISYVLAGGVHVETLSTNNHASTSAINLTGNSLAQTIVGNAGANVLIGGGGNDFMNGLGGDDIYYIDVAGVGLAEAAGGGNDAIYAGISYVLAGGVQVETLSTNNHASTAAINLTGNSLAQTIIGNAGANVLIGGGGNDFMNGLGGNDTYYVDVAATQVFEVAGGGSDTIYTSVSYTLAATADVETLSTMSHGATTAIDLTGNGINNTLFGNNGANILNGGGGNDSMVGLGGNDTYYVDTVNDLVIEAVGGGNDTIYSSVSLTLAADTDVENLSTVSHGATNAIDLTGNGLNNTLFGNAGANTLDGKSGNDFLVGLGGADIFAMTTALGAGNVDTIVDFEVGIDKIRLGGEAGQPFSALASGALAAGAFVIGSAALQADDILIYNSTTGALLYDADGSGAGAAVQFATLATGLSLTAADFVVSGPANNAPAISSGGTASVAENSPASTIVYQTTATDADGDRITYSLGGADASLFTIDANGAVRLITPADFETRTTYNFTVLASDSGPNPGSRQVVLSVTDVNEGGPSTPIINETSAMNDSSQTAQTIDRGVLIVANNPNLPDDDLPSATINGSIALDADRDYFSITLQAGERLVLDIDGTTGGLDSLLRIYGTNGLEIGDNDDQVEFDPGSNPPFGHNTDSFISFRAPTSGTYYFSVESFEASSSGSYQLHVSVGPPATPEQLIDEDINALISGAEWNDADLTYGFPQLASQYPASFSEPDDGFAGFTEVQQTATRSLLQLVANVSSLTFQELTASPGNADLRYAMSNEPDVAYAYYPTNGGPNSVGGSSWYNNGANGTRFANPTQGNYAWMGILHETGHALGLKHGHELPAISFDRDSVEYSVMTYRSYPGHGTTGGYRNETWGYPQTLMMYDIAALQRIYGANFATNSGDSVYSWNLGSGAMSINGTPATAPGGNRVFLTVWDGGGSDTYDLGNYGDNLTIDLRPGEWSLFGADNVQLANLGDNHFARGNVANALQFEGDPRSLIENAIGGSGQDAIVANQAANRLTGNSGSDAFTWKTSAAAGTGILADTVTDFVTGSDKIDLSAIDAIPATQAADSFSFIGTGAFTNTAGQVRYEVQGSDAHILADLDGNGVADMQIILNNVTVLNSTDFFL